MNGFRVLYFKSLPSTNAYLMKEAAADCRALLYTAVAAGEQTAGRGRFGRSFYSPPGAGLYLSVLLPYDAAVFADGPPLTVKIGVAAAEAVEAVSGAVVGIKWVNDLAAGGGKLGGILCESSADRNGERFIVAGIGINIKNIENAGFPPELRGKAVSLESLGCGADPRVLAETLLVRIKFYLGAPDGDVIEKYRSRLTLVGRRIAYSGASAGEGTVLGVDGAGRLLIDTGEGVKALNSGEITLAGDNLY